MKRHWECNLILEMKRGKDTEEQQLRLLDITDAQLTIAQRVMVQKDP